MNHEQLDHYLKNLKSSSSEPGTFDPEIEQRMLAEFAMLQVNRRRRYRITVALCIVFALATGLLASGSDVAVANYFGVQTSVDDEGHVEFGYRSLWSRMIDHVHDHLRQLHGSH